MTTQPADLTELEWSFGDRLRKIRRVVGASQDDFAAVLEVGKESLAAWELGVNTPRNIVALSKRIELAYGVPAGWTLGIQESPHPDPDGGEGAPRPGLEPGTLGGHRRYTLAELDRVQTEGRTTS